MTKSDLARRLAEQFPGLRISSAKEMLELFLSAMKKGLESGDTIEIREFGVLRIRDKKKRKSRNPRTGEMVEVPAKKVVYFKQSRIMKRNLKQGRLS